MLLPVSVEPPNVRHSSPSPLPLSITAFSLDFRGESDMKRFLLAMLLYSVLLAFILLLVFWIGNVQVPNTGVVDFTVRNGTNSGAMDFTARNVTNSGAMDFTARNVTNSGAVDFIARNLTNSKIPFMLSSTVSKDILVAPVPTMPPLPVNGFFVSKTRSSSNPTLRNSSNTP